MVSVSCATSSDRSDVERLIAAYHFSEGVTPKKERISRAVEQQIRNRFPGILLVAKERDVVLGVALAVYQPSAELGRTLILHDFFVEANARRKAVE